MLIGILIEAMRHRRRAFVYRLVASLVEETEPWVSAVRLQSHIARREHTRL